MVKKFYDYSNIQIERNIPIPAEAATPRGSKVALLISRLNLGDSFTIPNPSQLSVLQYYAKKSGMVLRLRNVGTMGQNVYRVWRIK